MLRYDVQTDVFIVLELKHLRSFREERTAVRLRQNSTKRSVSDPQRCTRTCTESQTTCRDTCGIRTGAGNLSEQLQHPSLSPILTARTDAGGRLPGCVTLRGPLDHFQRGAETPQPETCVSAPYCGASARADCTRHLFTGERSRGIGSTHTERREGESNNG